MLLLRGKLPKELNIKCAHCAVVVALNQSWGSQKELLRFFHLSEGGSALDSDLRQYRKKKERGKKKGALPPHGSILLPPSLGGVQAACEHPLPPSAGHRPASVHCDSEATRCGAAHRSAAGGEQRGEANRRAEEGEEVEDGRTATLRQAGLYPTVSRPFNMPRGNKRLAGIIALIASLLLGSCGTGAGERLRAPLALFRRDVEWGVFLKVIPVVYYSTWTHSAVMNENNMFGRL